MDAARRCSALCLLAALADTSAWAADPPDPSGWVEATSSPVPVEGALVDLLEQGAQAVCGTGDGALRAVAKAVVARKLRGLPMPEADALASLQRAAGEPHPWPRAWAASARGLTAETTLPKLQAWLAETGNPALRRCGVASAAAADGTRVLVVIAVDAFADVAPIPIRGRTGQWLSVEARLYAPATGGVVTFVEPDGEPRSVPTSFDGKTLRARFALGRPGEFAIQVVADLAGGPRPVIEASVFADVEPGEHEMAAAAPGERAGDGLDDEDGLARMLAAARASTGEPAILRDPRLDTIARRHAQKMSATHRLAHDAGDGDPTSRVRAAGLDALATGENAAHAKSVVLAHRSLWASPSHRANVVRRDFDHYGVGTARDEQGDVWVVEMFAAGLAP